MQAYPSRRKRLLRRFSFFCFSFYDALNGMPHETQISKEHARSGYLSGENKCLSVEQPSLLESSPRNMEFQPPIPSNRTPSLISSNREIYMRLVSPHSLCAASSRGERTLRGSKKMRPRTKNEIDCETESNIVSR